MTVKQRMLDTLPDYYWESPEVDAIVSGQAGEIDKTRDDARDLLDNIASVSGATWGLDEWDRLLQLPPMPNSPLDLRRARILAKLNGTAPATVKYLTDLVNAYVEHKDARIITYNPQYSFEAVIPLDNTINTGDIYKAVNEIKPAHLDFDLVGTIDDGITVNNLEYGFDVPYRICNMFRTDDAKGLGVNATNTLNTKEYGFDVAYPICGVFYSGMEA